MDESKATGVNVLGPDVNESSLKFSVNRHGDIRSDWELLREWENLLYKAS